MLGQYYVGQGHVTCSWKVQLLPLYSEDSISGVVVSSRLEDPHFELLGRAVGK